MRNSQTRMRSHPSLRRPSLSLPGCLRTSGTTFFDADFASNVACSHSDIEILFYLMFEMEKQGIAGSEQTRSLEWSLR